MKFLSLLARLPWAVLYALSSVLYYMVYYLVRYRRQVVRKNLVNSFPEKTTAEIVRIEKLFYRHFCDLFVEILKLMRMKPEELLERMKFKNDGQLNDWLAQGRSVIGLIGHYGNWEYITAYQLHCPQVHVMQLYKRLTNEFSEKLMLYIRQRFGSESVESASAYRRLLTAQRNHEQVAVGFIADQAFWPAHFWMDFMHQDAPVYEGAQRIASNLDFALVYFDMRKTSRGHYEIEVVPMAGHPAEYPEHELTVRYIRLLEQTIRRQPELYLWTHNRWKYQRP